MNAPIHTTQDKACYSFKTPDMINGMICEDRNQAARLIWAARKIESYAFEDPNRWTFRYFENGNPVYETPWFRIKVYREETARIKAGAALLAAAGEVR